MRALVLVLCLSGCANGVVMTDKQVIACRNVGCAALTESDLLKFMGGAYKQGYEKGWIDSNRQGGRSL